MANLKVTGRETLWMQGGDALGGLRGASAAPGGDAGRFSVPVGDGVFTFAGYRFGSWDETGWPRTGRIVDIVYTSPRGTIALTGMGTDMGWFRAHLADGALDAWLLGGPDAIAGGQGDDWLAGHDGDDRLLGGRGEDHLSGGAGNDLLDGGLGDDVLEGGAGDDVYIVRDAGDRVVEVATGGTDTVRSTVSHTLADHVENLTLLGTAALTGIGNDLDNVIRGNRGQTLIEGRGGDDLIILGTQASYSGTANYAYGGDGNDVIKAGNSGAVASGDAGDDRVFGGAAADYLYGQDGDDLVSGGAGSDFLSGGDGNDRLVGGAGADRFLGGDGADRFVFEAGDLTRPNPSRDVDWVMDFDPGEGDRIDLRAIDADITIDGDQAFTRVDHFTGQAGQYVATPTADPRSHQVWLYVAFDVDGDGRADFALKVSGDMDGGAGWLL